MPRLSDRTTILATETGPVLWQRDTGRGLMVRAEALGALLDWPPGLPLPVELQPLARRLQEHHLLEEGAPPRLEVLFAARSRLPLLLPDRPALWHPLPQQRSAGGHGWTMTALSPTELALWRGMNGARRLVEVAERADSTLEEALRFLGKLTSPELQAASLWPAPPRPREPALSRLVGPPRPLAPRQAHQFGLEGETSLALEHALFEHAETHFDDRETTVAHAFAPPHPALGGRPYGAALHAALEARGLLPEDGTMLEIGPGSGELGEAFLSRAAERGLPRGELLRLDASPALLAAQERRLPGTRGLLGNATDIPLPDHSLAFVLCNEVIADLSAVPCDVRDPAPGPEATEVLLRLRRYGIEPLPGEAPLYNLGAWRLLEELARVLRPGGTAFLSEFGGLEEAPTETRYLDHPEVSIHFGHLCTIARALGMRVDCLPLPELLEMDLRARWLSRASYEGLRALHQREGLHLSARAWQISSLSLPWTVEGLEEVPISEEGPAPVPTRFMALLLTART